jgi:hypothetical protein
MNITTFFYLFKEVVINTLSITALVMIMLLLVEFVNVSSSGKMMQKLKKRPVYQILVASLLGMLPGCIGGFAIVSLFTHELISFGALLSGMLCCFGDEAFVLLATSPPDAGKLFAFLFVVGMISGLLTHFIFKQKKKTGHQGHPLPLHVDCDTRERPHQHYTASPVLSVKNLRQVSFPRAILVFGLCLYLFFLLTGMFSHRHSALPDFSSWSTPRTEQSPAYSYKVSCQVHTHVDFHEDEAETFSWENILFILLSLITLCIVALTSEHFLQEHLWQHVIKQHFVRVLVWTFLVLLVLQFVLYFVDIRAILEQERWAIWIMLILALFIGLIPESGPHLFFVVMYLNHTIPFSIFLANAIVQEGHSALPLLAETPKTFLQMKIIKILIGLLAGVAGFFIGF